MGLITFALFVVIYLLPTIIAWNKQSVAGIAILNILLGFTILGWIIALIWAVEAK